MPISNHYIKVEKCEEEKQEGFQLVQVMDSSHYKGRVVTVPETPVCLGNHQIAPNDIVLFAKGSPDTHDIEKFKYVRIDDLLEVL